MTTDTLLVERSLRGDRQAFEQIVAGNQTLICSVALAAVGDVGQSEDVAQETFVIAWRRMAELREPQKLRSWLCGITRNLAANALRRRRGTQQLDPAAQSPLPSPLEHAISHEEQAILWRSLERIPAIYRQPMILFYRQEHSVRDVAEALELSEETVRQRLFRGRQMLAEQVTSLVERTLRQSAPKRAFTLAVMASLPVAATSAKAAAIGAAAAKGSVLAHSAGAVGIAGALLGPLIGLLGGYAGVRAGLDATHTPGQRQFVMRGVKRVFAVSMLFNVGLALFIFLATSVGVWRRHPVLMLIFGVGYPLGYTVFLVRWIVLNNRAYRVLAEQERRLHPEAFPISDAPRDYRTPITLLGLPLVHIRFSADDGMKAPPVVGWIAIGDRAFGVLFAAGGVAVGGISMGGFSVGLLAIGGGSLGLLALGGMAVGALAVGGGAIGLVATGGLATGWRGAIGGVAIAHQFAVGGIAMAAHANDAAARGFLRGYRWLDVTHPLYRNVATALIWLPAILALLFYNAWRKRRRMPMP